MPPLVGAGIMGCPTVETSAIAMWNKNFRELWAQEDIDLGHLENSASHLAAQLDSLGEVVLQNQRKLSLWDREVQDIGKTCFYANNSGIIKSKFVNGQ